MGVGLFYLLAGAQSEPATADAATASLSVSTTGGTDAAPGAAGATGATARPRLLGATTSTLPTTTTSTEPSPQPVLAFDAAQAMAHVEKLAAGIGVRRGGTEAEAEAARYAADYLNGLGYQTGVTEVPVPNGLTSHNVVAVKTGSSSLTIVVGGHIDSKTPSPGGNDNASGAAAVLELARDVKDADIVPTVIFVLFGNEETIDPDPDHHHYGSRAYVQQMTAADQENLVAMISLDMVGYGDTFNVRTMGRGPSKLRDMLQDYASVTGVDLTYLKDPSSFGYSDHEPFELAGYPAVWLEWREDPLYHTTGDTFEHCDADRILAAGALMLGFLAELTQSDLEALKIAKQ